MTEDESGDPKKRNEVPTWLAAARAELDAVDGGSGNGISHDENNATTPTSSLNMTTIRQQFGTALSSISDTINNNLIIVRYVTLSSVLLLGAYGVVNTPLFFRYKRISELPVRAFTKRHWLHGRIVGVIHNNGNVQDTANTTTAASPIVILFRHYSPIERLLGRPLFTTTTTNNTPFGGERGKSMTNASPGHGNTRNVLRIELAGITGPPTTTILASQSRNKNSLLSPSLTAAGKIITPPTTTSEATLPLLNEIIQQENKVSVQRCVKTTSINNSLASKMAWNVRNEYWKKMDRVVEYKQRVVCEQGRRSEMDKRLIFLVKQTERYGECLLTTTATATPTTTTNNSNDDD